MTENVRPPAPSHEPFEESLSSSSDSLASATPAGRLLVQFFLIPAFVVGVAVFVFWLFGSLAVDRKTAAELLSDVRTGSRNQRWQAAFELTLLSTVRLVRAVIPHMRRAGGGAIINLQSTSVKVPLDNMILSNSIRTGVIGLAKSLSIELAKDNIRVNNVLPGAIMTDRQRQMLALQSKKSGQTVEEVRRLRESKIPLGRFGESEELADMIVFLASDRAKYVTGATVQVDGGLARSLM